MHAIELELSHEHFCLLHLPQTYRTLREKPYHRPTEKRDFTTDRQKRETLPYSSRKEREKPYHRPTEKRDFTTDLQKRETLR